MLHSDGDRFCRRYRVYTHILSQRRGLGFISVYKSVYTHTLSLSYTHTHTHEISYSRLREKTVNFTPSSSSSSRAVFIIFLRTYINIK